MLEERIIELESLFAHLQRMVSDLNETILLNNRRLDEFEKRFQKLEHRLNAMSDNEPGDDDEGLFSD